MDEFHQPSSLFSLHTWQIEWEIMFKVAKPIDCDPWFSLLIGVFVWVKYSRWFFYLKFWHLLETHNLGLKFSISLLSFDLLWENLSWNLKNTNSKVDAFRFLILCTGNKVHDSCWVWVSLRVVFVAEKSGFSILRPSFCRFRLENSDMYEWKKNASF